MKLNEVGPMYKRYKELLVKAGETMTPENKDKFVVAISNLIVGMQDEIDFEKCPHDFGLKDHCSCMCEGCWKTAVEEHIIEIIKEDNSMSNRKKMPDTEKEIGDTEKLVEDTKIMEENRVVMLRKFLSKCPDLIVTDLIDHLISNSCPSTYDLTDMDDCCDECEDECKKCWDKVIKKVAEKEPDTVETAVKCDKDLDELVHMFNIAMSSYRELAQQHCDMGKAHDVDAETMAMEHDFTMVINKIRREQ